MARPTAPDAGRLLSAAAASALKIVANLVVALNFALMAFVCYRRFALTGSPSALGLLIVNSLFVCMYVARREASTISRAPSLWLLAFAGTMLPMLLRPGELPGLPEAAGTTVQLTGILLIIAAMLSLRRSFGIVPANRGIRDGGLYRVVRHPLYAAELLSMLGFVIANPTLPNALLWAGAALLQFLRARAEETFLSADAAYRAYLGRVRYRLIPGVV